MSVPKLDCSTEKFASELDAWRNAASIEGFSTESEVLNCVEQSS